MPHDTTLSLSRRDAILSMGLAGAAALAASPRALAHPHEAADRKRIIRLAHMTDMHVQPERKGDQGLIACFKHAMAHPDRPELVLTGGDLVMDIFEQEQARSAMLMDMFTRIVKDECGVPVEHCIGNHDIWGWNQRKSKTTSAEARWGKAWAIEALGLSNRYRGFDRGNWRFLVLDGVQPHNGDGYTAYIDEEQWAWLEGELAAAAAAKRHVLVLSHIPIVSIGALDRDARTTQDGWEISGGVMHTDAQKLFALFKKHGCVRVCLSGHIHKVERIDYEGISYIGDGAVSGAWWRGRRERCDEGYGVVDLYDNGTFDHQYVTYGWKAVEE